eukprot:15340862-Ditylum_brightwellii.AAC.1
MVCQAVGNISTGGSPNLGGFIGSKHLAQAYAEEKVEDQMKYINTFSSMMANQPQAAFASYTRSLQFEWAYLQQTIEVEEQ